MGSLTSIPKKAKEHTILENQFQTQEGQEYDQKYSAQIHKEKLFLTIPIAFYNEIERVVDAVYLDFSKSFATFT